MENLCRKCLNLRQSLSLIRRTPSYQIGNIQKQYKLTKVIQSCSYSTNDRTSERKYKHGKLIVEKFEDPTIYPSFLMTFSGTDEAVLDGYIHTVKKAAKMVEVNLIKSFSMAAIEETFKAKKEGKGLVSAVVYNLKHYQRVVEIQELTGEKSDIFLEYVHQEMPSGVKLNVQLQKWEKMVDPNHIMFRDED